MGVSTWSSISRLDGKPCTTPRPSSWALDLYCFEEPMPAHEWTCMHLSILSSTRMRDSCLETPTACFADFIELLWSIFNCCLHRRCLKNLRDNLPCGLLDVAWLHSPPRSRSDNVQSLTAMECLLCPAHNCYCPHVMAIRCAVPPSTEQSHWLR